MNSVNVTELRQYLPDYLKQVQQGEEIAITLHYNWGQDNWGQSKINLIQL